MNNKELQWFNIIKKMTIGAIIKQKVLEVFNESGKNR